MVRHLPIEIIEQIVYFLPNNTDIIQCLLTCKAWHAILYRILVRSVTIKHRRQLKQFLQLVSSKHEDDAQENTIGRHVRELHLKNRVGLTKEHFKLLGQYCPYIEVFKFRDWRHYKLSAFQPFKRLKQIPKIYDRFKGQAALFESRMTLTHLELGMRICRDLVVQGWLLPFLSLGSNLTHLRLDGYFNPTTRMGHLEFNFFHWDALHHLCKHLTHIQMHSVILTATVADVKNMEAAINANTVDPMPRMKSLDLKSLSIENPIWLPYLAKKYPNLHTLVIRFDMCAFIHYQEPYQVLEPEECCTAFLAMADYVSPHLRTLTLQSLYASHFPGKAFFDNLTSKDIKLDSLQVNFETNRRSLVGLSMPVLKSMLVGQTNTLKKLDIDLWVGAQAYFRDFLQPIAACSRLVDLHLCNDDLVQFHFSPIPLDVLLDECAHLQKLSLGRIALVIEDKHTTNQYHPLKHFAISVARIDEALFRYLSARCPDIDHLDVDTCFWMPRELEMKIHMPHNRFEYVHIGDFNKIHTPRMEGDLGNGMPVNIFGVAQLDKVQKQRARYQHSKHTLKDVDEEDITSWYHLYEIDDGRVRYPPSALRKLRPEEVISLKGLIIHYQANYHLEPTMALDMNMIERFVPKKDWRDDVHYGYVALTCKSVRTLKYNFNRIDWAL
jgi:hypothetical protein